MTRVKIRKITKRGVPRILEMSGEFIEEYRMVIKMKTKVSVETALKYKKKIFERDIGLGVGAVFVAEKDGTFLGYVFVLSFVPGMENAKRYSPGYISDLHIRKDFRRMGIAKKLYRSAEKWLMSKNKHEVSLDVGVSNKMAKSLYKNLGFEIKSIKMEKKLYGVDW